MPADEFKAPDDDTPDDTPDSPADEGVEGDDDVGAAEGLQLSSPVAPVMSMVRRSLPSS